MAVLAYYTIRSKQAYIFRNGHLPEITGASRLIGETWDLLFEKAGKEGGLKTKRYTPGQDAFSEKETREAFENGSLQMVEVYLGGGNETILFDGMESYRKANAAYTYALLRDYHGMVPMSVAVEVTWNYREDWKNLMELADEEKNRMTSSDSIAMMPFSQLDRKVMQPITHVLKDGKDAEEVTAEAAAKHRRGFREKRDALDDLVTKKGEESLLAIVHADGNNMGVKIQKDLEGSDSGYEASVNKMRQFAYESQRVFSGVGVKAVEAELAMMKNCPPVRWLVNDGDDVTFICNARAALRLTEAYLQAVEAADSPYHYSSCAGICIYHSHYPSNIAYDLAEQACDSAKACLRESGNTDGSWIDFHYLHAGLSDDLDQLRKEQETDILMARPLPLTGRFDDHPGVDTLVAVAKAMKGKVTRGNIKTLGSAWERDREEGKAEYRRVCARTPGLEKRLAELIPEGELRMKVIYDLSEIYDLWFADERGVK